MKAIKSSETESIEDGKIESFLTSVSFFASFV